MAEPLVTIIQLFSMKTKRESLQLCRDPDGRYIIVAGDLTQPGGSFQGGWWSKNDIRRLRDALSRELADG